MADRAQSAAAAERVAHIRERLSKIRPPVSSELGTFLAGPVQDELQLLEFMLTEEAAQHDG